MKNQVTSTDGTKKVTINNVSIGDKFKINPSSQIVGVIVDIQEITSKSLLTGESSVKYGLLAETDGAINRFDVAFSTVVRNRIN